jgi:uncharacterized membrane protein
MIATILILLFYFLPTFLAKAGSRSSVFVINLLFGWTLIGWGIALYLAVKSNEGAAAAR